LVYNLPFKLSLGVLALGGYYKYWAALLPDSASFAIKAMPSSQASSKGSISTFVWGGLGVSVIAAMAAFAHKPLFRSSDRSYAANS
jgi:hypothetical protein